MELHEVGPRDPRMDGMMGVGTPSGCTDFERWNKYRGRLVSFIGAMLIYIAANFIGPAILIALFIGFVRFVMGENMQLQMTGYYGGVLFAFWINLLMFRVPFAAYYGLRTQKSVWTVLSYTFFWHVASWFGGSPGGRLNSTALIVYYD